MKKILKIGILLIIVIVFAYFYSHIEKNHTVYDHTLDSSTYVGINGINNRISQQFICKENSLDAINIKLQVQGTNENTKIQMQLVDDLEKKVVATQTMKASDIQNSKFNTFEFKTLNNCKNKVYSVVFETVTSNVNPTDSIVYVYTPQVELGTIFTINNVKTEGTLVVKTVTHKFDIETFCVLLIFVLYIFIFMKFLYKLFK